MAKKLTAIIIAVILVLAAVPAAVFSAAAPSVEVIDGIRTAFMSSFGRMTFNTEVYPAYRTFEEALAALGNDGGRIIFSGTVDLSNYTDADGRGPLTFEGTGKPSGSVLDFGEAEVIELRGDTYVNKIMIKTVPDAVIHTNGHVFETSGSFECNYREQFIEGGNNVVTYISPFVFSAGALGGGVKAKTVKLSSGHYKAVAAGSVGDAAVNADTSYEIGGGNFESVYAGNYNSTSSFSGNSEIVIKDGVINRLTAGSDSGETRANLSVLLSGGTVDDMYIGSDSGAMIDGNVCITLGGGKVSKYISAKETVRGKVIFVGGDPSKVPEGSYDYFIKTVDASVKPVYNGMELAGFEIGDANGFIPSKVYANGSEIHHTNGIFSLPEGEITVSCESEAAISVNKNAVYVSGYEDGTFLPQNNITRAEAATMLAKLICNDISALSSVAACGYADVEPNAWYAGVMGFFEKLGYFEKLEEENGSLIKPGQYITRAEFSELARHVLTVICGGREFGVVNFPDVKPDYKYYDSVGQLGYLGVIGGYEDGSFRPENSITRAEAVTIVNRMLGRIPTGEIGQTIFSDVGEHWAKAQIAAACNPSEIGGAVVWTVTDVTKGNFELLSGDGVTVGDQIKNLREKRDLISAKDAISGIDAISRWQINNILNSKSEYNTSGKVYYISNNGDDSADGLSPQTAWKNLNRITGINAVKQIKAGDSILFERGGEWRGKLQCIAGVTYSAYGEGAKPVINSSKHNYADEKYWGETEYPNIYKLKLAVPNAGIMVFDFSGIPGNYKETVGTLKVAGTGGVEGYGDLRNDLEFFSDLSTGELYLYCEGGNPAERFKSIEIGGEGGCVSIPSPGNVTIDNMTFRLTGTHAIAIGGIDNVTVRNCTFDYLGGSILRGFHGVNTTRYGNALQVYGSCDGWYLYDNWMYQIYDTGVTHQYNSPYDKKSATMDNVRYVGNVIEYCHWSIEYYNPDYGDGKHTFHNTYIADNICRLNGYGWGSVPRRKSSTLFQSAGIPADTKNFVAENNIFDRSAGLLININSVGDKKLVLRDNIYVQKQGVAMGNLFGTSWIANSDAADRIAKSCGDTTSIIIYNNDTAVDNYFE